MKQLSIEPKRCVEPIITPWGGAMESPSTEPESCSLLVVDDEPLILATLSGILANDFDVVTASTVEEAREVLARRPIDILIADQNMPTTSGVQLLEWVRES